VAAQKHASKEMIIINELRGTKILLFPHLAEKKCRRQSTRHNLQSRNQQVAMLKKRQKNCIPTHERQLFFEKKKLHSKIFGEKKDPVAHPGTG